MFRHSLLPLLALALTSCGGEGASTTDVKQAAIEQVRTKFRLASTVRLEARTWTGREHDGEITMCGTVSGVGNSATTPPQRFAATLEPLEFLVLEDAHDQMVVSQPDKFAEWAPLCAETQAA